MMVSKYCYIFLACSLLAGCNSSTSHSEADLVSEERDSLLQEAGDTAQAVLSEEQGATEKKQEAIMVTDANFPLDQGVEFTKEMLQGLCTNKYGCLEETIYPVGWSRDGKFAYLIQETNEAVSDFTLHLIIQDMETDKRLVETTFRASDQPGYTEADDQYTAASVWDAERAKFNDFLRTHAILAGNGTQFYSLSRVEAERSHRFTSRNTEAYNELFDRKFITEHHLQASQQGKGMKTILKHTFGKYDLAIATQPLGYFQSPFEDRVAVLDAWEARGYEGPPNVLKLMVVGCDLSKGFQ